MQHDPIHIAACQLSCFTPPQLVPMGTNKASLCNRKLCVQAALVAWQHMVLLASKAPTSGSPASIAAKRSLFAGMVTPVLQLLIVVPPGAHTQQGAHPSLCPQVLLLDALLLYHYAAEAWVLGSFAPALFACLLFKSDLGRYPTTT